MKYLRYLAIALITFVFGVAISPIRFYRERIACGFTVDGDLNSANPFGSASTTGYSSSYFIQVSSSYSDYLSPAKANKVFERELNNAEKIVEVETKISSKGNVERRAVRVYFKASDNRNHVAIIWTDGSVVREISSSSYLHAIEFEKRVVQQ